MIYSSVALSRQKFAAILFAVGTFAMGACSSTGSSSIPLSSKGANAASSSVHPNATPHITFSFQPVTDSSPGAGNEQFLTGIDSNTDSEVVGDWGRTHASSNAFTSGCPSASSCYTTFTTVDYQNAVGTYLSSITNNGYLSGAVYSPQGFTCGTCGVIYKQGPGTWTVVQNPSEGSGSCAITELLGLDDSQVGVGYYQANGAGSNCVTHAFEAYKEPSGAWQYWDFNLGVVNASNPMATGMNGKSDVVGSATFILGKVAGWFYRDTVYVTGLSAPGSSSTQPLGLNWQDDMVGSYVDSSGKTHGFVMFNPQQSDAAQQQWQYPVDVPSALNPDGTLTVVSSINNHDDISGWYEGTDGHLHGFVATGTCSGCAKPTLIPRHGTSPLRPGGSSTLKPVHGQ